MNKRIKKKIAKGKFWYHKGQMLHQHHPYQQDKRSRQVMMLYDPEFGCEYYFHDWKDAKFYLRRIKIFVTRRELMSQLRLIQLVAADFVTENPRVPYPI